jgi:hypothetical protein
MSGKEKSIEDLISDDTKLSNYLTMTKLAAFRD